VICLLDTNVISQRKAKKPDISVIRFLNGLPQENSFLSVITLMEIRFGIERLEASSGRRGRLESWLMNDIQSRSFAGRILPVTNDISQVAGIMLAAERRMARAPYIPDLLIAATAKVYGMEIATLNRKHFENLGVPLVDL
jgi:predicted nucleic acid-binding protein